MTRRLFIGAAICAPPAMGAVFGSLSLAANWYVDSVGGSDGNAGTSPAQAFLTIAKLLTQTITTGQVIGLKCGSSWREELLLPAASVQVIAYGSGAMPLLDCSDVISAGAWTKTGGQTNVYQASLPIDASSITWVSAWENSVRLVRATSIANCDATAGSYFPSSDTSSPITLYLHSTNDTSPAVNGKTYEYSKRQTGINDQGFTSAYVSGIQTRRNLLNDGSLRLAGTFPRIDSCLATEGTKHNILVGAGALVTNTTARDLYFGGQQGILFVYNANTPSGQPITFRGCTATNTAFVANSIGFFGHSNVSGNYGLVTLDTCSVSNCTNAMIPNNGTYFHILSPSISGCSFGIQQWMDGSITGGSIAVVGRCVEHAFDGITSVISGVAMSCSTTNTSCIWGASAHNSIVSLTSCSFTGSNSIAQLGTGSVLTSNGNTLIGGFMYNLPAYANFTFVGDNNNYSGGSESVLINGSFQSLALWKAATGQDVHST